MAVTYDIIARMVVHNLNAAEGSWSASSSDPAYLDEAIWHSVLDAEAEQVEAILNDMFHGRRQHAAGLIASVTVAYAGAIPTHIGPLVSVFVGSRQCVPAPLELVTRVKTGLMIRMDSRLSDGLYAEDPSGNLYFTGTGSATVRLGVYARPQFADYAAFLAATPLAPPEDFAAISDRAVGRLLPKEGDNIGVAQTHWLRGEARLNLKRGQKMIAPELKTAERRPEAEI